MRRAAVSASRAVHQPVPPPLTTSRGNERRQRARRSPPARANSRASARLVVKALRSHTARLRAATDRKRAAPRSSSSSIAKPLSHPSRSPPAPGSASGGDYAGCRIRPRRAPRGLGCSNFEPYTTPVDGDREARTSSNVARRPASRPDRRVDVGVESTRSAPSAVVDVAEQSVYRTRSSRRSVRHRHPVEGAGDRKVRWPSSDLVGLTTTL